MTVNDLRAEIKAQLGFSQQATLSRLTDDMLLAKLNQAAEQVANDVPLLQRIATIPLTSTVGEYALPIDVLEIQHNGAEIITITAPVVTSTPTGVYPSLI